MADETTNTPKTDRAEFARVIADRVLVGLVLLSGVALGVAGDGEHAGMCIAGALGALGAMRSGGGTAASTVARAMPLALALGVGAMLSGCAGTTAGTVGRVTCAVVERARDACHVAGLAPDAPCPVVFSGSE